MQQGCICTTTERGGSRSADHKHSRILSLERIPQNLKRGFGLYIIYDGFFHRN